MAQASLLLPTIPVTEQPNELSNQVDLLSSEEFVRIMRQIDCQLFTGWRQYAGLLDPSITQTLMRSAQKMAEVLRDPSSGVIILSGCGTSGRVAFLIARTINHLLKSKGLPPCAYYTISGGDRALICSDELPEDDPIAGQRDLQGFVQDKKKVVYIGISCGISAPYVAGQVDFCMRQPVDVYTTIIMGFNPVACVRNVPIELWSGRSFFDVVQEFTRLQQQHSEHYSHLILNPVVGPEAITGSSRMKGGSVTKILLDLMVSCSFQYAFSSNNDAVVIENTSFLTNEIGHFLSTWHLTYQSPSNIASIITSAGDCLLNNGRLFYVGDEVMGLMGLIDASEMPDTFGQPHSRIRAFVRGGWQTVQAQTGDLAAQFSTDPLFRISLDDFSRDIVPTLTSRDAVIVCSNQPLVSLGADLQRCWTESVSKRAHVSHVVVYDASSKHSGEMKANNKEVRTGVLQAVQGAEARVEVGLTRSSLVQGDLALATLVMKWVLNAVTTGTNVRAGMVVGNDMVNVTVANDKIYRRAVQIVARHSSTSLEAAEEALLRAIYQTDEVGAKLGLAVSQHCVRATQLYETRVVPQAIILASVGCSLAEAVTLLSEQQNVRLALQSVRRTKRPKEGQHDSPSSML